ncbi:hypothetical protein GN244_ATG09046 [Phytophthora infestans]|uniref:Uncharacterized protein n=1 Tax=Phytophthora infestans TaxID=4787 RepID=A0A833SUB7_PHYIN|nr:hypothetical protein GN244_ATG09046 [Phytophthora infestans]
MATEGASTEERKLPLFGMEKLFTTNTKLLKNAELAFTRYQLEAHTTLFGTNEFKLWAIHVNSLNKKSAGSIMLKTLLKHYDDATLARMIESAKSSESVADAAAKMRTAQFTRWKKTGIEPSTIEAQLLQLPNQLLWAKKDKKGYNEFLIAKRSSLALS